MVCLAGDGSEGGDCVEEDAAAGHGVFEHGVEDDSVEFDDVLWGGRRGGFLSDAVAADGGVETVFGVGISGVESAADVARVWAGCGFVYVGHVHDVVLESGVVVVAETTWRGVVEGDGDVGDGEGALLKGTTNSGWSTEEHRSEV